MSSNTPPAAPSGFVTVDKEFFFSVIGPLDVNPRNEHREYTVWETRSRHQIGWSAPGWANPSAYPNVYALTREAFEGATR